MARAILVQSYTCYKNEIMIEPLSGYCHLKTLVASRLCTFAKNLAECEKFPVRFLAKLQFDDLRTVLGRNLAGIAGVCGLNRCEISSLSPSCVKESMVYRPVIEEDAWKVSIAKELVAIINGESPTVAGFTPTEAKEMLDYVCVY